MRKVAHSDIKVIKMGFRQNIIIYSWFSVAQKGRKN